MARRKQTDTGERQTVKMVAWLTPTERAELDERIAAAGVPQKNPIPETRISELTAVGHKLNQLARRANMTEKIDPQELSEALRHWAKIVDGILETEPERPAWEKTEKEYADEERQWANWTEKAEREITKSQR